MQYERIYDELCKIFIFNKETKSISYKTINDMKYFFKNLLFKFCFLIDNGSIKFEKLEELWFFKDKKNTKEIELAIGIIELLIEKVKDINFDICEKNINLAKSLLNLMDYKKYKIFKYLQSIYSSHEDNSAYIIFPLYYTFLFDKESIKNNLKKDLKSIFEDTFSDSNFIDNIQYNNINIDFLKYFNALLLSDSVTKKKLFDYLCNFKENKLYDNDKSLKEIFSYFDALKNCFEEFDKKYQEIKDIKLITIGEKLEENKVKDNSLIVSTKKTENNGSNEQKESVNTDNEDNCTEAQKYFNLSVKLIYLNTQNSD